MRRTTLLTIVLVVASVAAIPVVGMAATGDDVGPQTNGTESNESNATVAPGERLSGVVGVQGAELEGEVDSRAFGLRVAQAATEKAKADAVAEQLGDIEKRLEGLEQRKEELDEARENGSMGEGEYRARVAELAARTETVERLANQTDETASGLPTAVLESNGIDVTAIQRLKNDAQNLSGPEVAEIARSIAGGGVGKAPGAVPGERPDDAGPPDGADPDTGNDNATDRPDGDRPTDSGDGDRSTDNGDENGDGSSDHGGDSQDGQSGSGSADR